MTSTSSRLPFVVVPKRREGRKRGARGNVYQENAAIESPSRNRCGTEDGADGGSHWPPAVPSTALPGGWPALLQDSSSGGSPTVATPFALGPDGSFALPTSTGSLSELWRETRKGALGRGLGAGHHRLGPRRGRTGPTSELAANRPAFPGGLEKRGLHRAARGGLRFGRSSSPASAHPGDR